MTTLAHVFTAIFAALVTVVGTALVGGAFVFIGLLLALNAWEYGVKAWRRVVRAVDPLGWWPK